MILDIGSGAGNTIFALLELYPTASIIASDLSVPLLSVVRDIRDTSYANRDCLIMQLTEDLVFEENQFDLVVGGAILHHLFDPRLTLEQCHKVLKPNGAAVFFEPFELGYQTIGLTLKHLLAMNAGRPENKQLDPRVAEFFRALAFDFDVRNGADKSAEIYTRIDDKWLFTRDYFEALSQSIGFRDVTITPLHGTVQQFGRQIDTFLRIGLQSTLSSLPQ